MAGRRGRGGDDLLSDSGNERVKGLRPGLLQMLFKGGSADKAQGHQDLRYGKTTGIRPRHKQMLYGGGAVPKPPWQPGLYGGGSVPKPSWQPGLFKGGPAKAVGTDDLRYGHYDSNAMKPNTMQMLYGGGQTADEDLQMGHDGESSIKPHNFESLDEGGEAFSSEEKLAAHEVMGAMKAGDPMKFLKAMKGLFMLMDDDGGQDMGPMDGQE